MDMGNTTFRIGVSLAISLVLDLGLLYTLALFLSDTDGLNNSNKFNGPIQVVLLPEVVHHSDQIQRKVPAQAATKPLPDVSLLDEPKIEHEESTPIIPEEATSDNNKEDTPLTYLESLAFTSAEMGEPSHDTNGITNPTEVSIEGIKNWLDEQIPRYLEYPPLARKRGIEGISRVELTVDLTGLLVHERIVQSSGNAILDKAALEVVRRVFPIPRELCNGQELVVLIIDITYSLR